MKKIPDKNLNMALWMTWLASMMILFFQSGCLLPEVNPAVEKNLDPGRMEAEKIKILQSIDSFSALLSKNPAGGLSKIRNQVTVSDLRGTWTASNITNLPKDNTPINNSQVISSMFHNIGSINFGSANFTHQSGNVTESGSWTWSTTGGNTFSFVYTGNLSGQNTKATGTASAIGQHTLSVSWDYFFTDSNGTKDLNNSWSSIFTLSRDPGSAPSTTTTTSSTTTSTTSITTQNNSLTTDLRGTWVSTSSFLNTPADSTPTNEINTILSLRHEITTINSGNATWVHQGVSENGNWIYTKESSTTLSNVYRFTYTGNLNGQITRAEGSGQQTSADSIQLSGNYYFVQTTGDKNLQKSWSFSVIMKRTSGNSGKSDVLTSRWVPSDVANHYEFFIQDIQNNESHKFKIDSNGFKFPGGNFNTAIVRTAYFGKPIGSTTAEEVLIPSLFVVDFFLQKRDENLGWEIDEIVILGQDGSDELPSDKNLVDEGHQKTFRFTGPFNSTWRGNYRGTVSGLTGVATLNLSIDQTDPDIVGNMISDNTAVWGNQPILNVIGDTNSFQCRVTLLTSNGLKVFPILNLSFDGISTVSGTIQDAAAGISATLTLVRI